MNKWKKYSLPLLGTAFLILLILMAWAMGNEYAAPLLWIVAVLALLIWGNLFIHKKLNELRPWTEFPLKRFLIQFLISGVYSLACVNFCYYFLKTLFLGMPPDGEQFFVLNLYGLLFIIPIISINFGIYFMQRWKKAFIQSEKLKEENMRSQLESLKTHIDPHFLFNNLNVLSSLIDTDTEDAHRFLGKFADVYRYVLQHRNEELVELDTELEFIQSYIYLFQKRLNRQLKIEIQYQPLKKAYFLPPLSIQMLVENAIKHNIATASHPLHVQIFTEEEKWLVVRNSFQPKNKKPSTLPQTGLENISKRIAYFSDEKVVVDQDEQYFTVKLPLLEADDDDNVLLDPTFNPKAI
ncbi:histidine kinase [Echinicola jeungdonensis]|uniref:Sensor histidine kinase n=1 Tax=Echinicola jeungdonensis TaxID=709343 RepID=A0ABV5JA74_9BACT|nr:histidine kinase [Echinicola jeungdonensis]MDN3670515.1 histidine kinase [Echinicola jeungdonensis]